MPITCAFAVGTLALAVRKARQPAAMLFDLDRVVTLAVGINILNRLVDVSVAVPSARIVKSPSYCVVKGTCAPDEGAGSYLLVSGALPS